MTIPTAEKTGSSPSRTIVVSDLHGNGAALERILEHAGFAPGDDRLIIAGDLIDVGPDDIVARAEELGATVLVGNHEGAAIAGMRIAPQHERSVAAGPSYAEKVLTGQWLLACAVGDALISHAGVSVALDDIANPVGGDVALLADTLNELFRAEVEQVLARRPLEYRDMDSFRLLGGSMGPLWFRPLMVEHAWGGVRQVVGHTPAEYLGERRIRELESIGWLLVEPGGHGRGKGYRYAVIDEDGPRLVTDQPF